MKILLKRYRLSSLFSRDIITLFICKEKLVGFPRLLFYSVEATIQMRILEGNLTKVDSYSGEQWVRGSTWAEEARYHFVMHVYVVALLLGVTGAFRDPNRFDHKPFSQDFVDRYNPLKFLGNYGPYSSRSGLGISTATPEGCAVDQVFLLGRHSERYPDPDDAKSHISVIEKIRRAHPGSFSGGDLAFLDQWKYFLDGNIADAALETRQGPYAGLASAYSFGSNFRQRYGHLWDGHSHVPIFSADSERVLNTARAFGEGFFGYNYSDIAAVQVLPEIKSAGANALSPVYCKTPQTSHCNVDISSIIFPAFDKAASRLNSQYQLGLNGSDINILMEIGSFDVSASGTSPWLNVFTSEEWISYEYLRTLDAYCNQGPQSEVGMAIGGSLMKAVSKLLSENTPSLPISLNFAYDTVITKALAAAGILIPKQNLSTTQVVLGSGYDITDIAPMGARLVIERLACDNDHYVRVILNDAVLPLEFEYSGPGFSTSLSNFTTHIDQRVQMYNYSDICAPAEAGVPEAPSFWWNYNTSDNLNYQVGPILFQQNFGLCSEHKSPC